MDTYFPFGVRSQICHQTCGLISPFPRLFISINIVGSVYLRGNGKHSVHLRALCCQSRSSLETARE